MVGRKTWEDTEEEELCKDDVNGEPSLMGEPLEKWKYLWKKKKSG